MSFEERIEKLNELIAKSNNIVFFGGAGVSTASGLPDFRSEDGLYNQKDSKYDNYTLEDLLSATCLYYEPKVFYDFYRQKLDCRKVEPNTTHYKLTELEKAGKLKAIITQNIDGLHQKAGSKQVYEIHGTTKRNYCMSCGEEYDENHIFNTTGIPYCHECGGRIRPDVVLYEENLPQKAWNRADTAIYYADLLIVAGTSLSVWPAASLVQSATCPIVLVNKDEVDLKFNAELTFTEDMCEVFERIKI